MEINIESLLNLPNLRILDCVVSDKETHIHCESTENFGVCLVCQKKTSQIQMYQEHTIRDMALLGRKFFALKNTSVLLQ